jgi:putative transposase
LQVSWFLNLFDARRQIETWRGHYNTDRPHSSLGYRTPLEFAALSRAAGQCSAGVGQGISNADPLPNCGAQKLRVARSSSVIRNFQSVRS